MATNNNPTSSILLKRSGVAGSVPTTTSLQVGEIALNTYDGKAFLHKSGSTDEVVEIVVAGAKVTGSISLTGAVSASVVSASSFVGYGGALTGVTASMRPDDFDFNSDPFAGTIGYIQGSGSLYKVATTSASIDFRYNDVTIATITSAQGFSGSLYGIGDVLAFSGSVATRLFNLEISASFGPDAGEI
jgi:hypothetical protein